VVTTSVAALATAGLFAELHAGRRRVNPPLNSTMMSFFVFVDVDRCLLVLTVVGRHYERYLAHCRLALPTTFDARYRPSLPMILVASVE